MAKILLADDDLTILGFVQMVLETQNHHVVTARNGADALDLFFEESPDVVLLDVMMPQMNGMDVCEKIRAAAPLVPIILLTAKQQVQDVVNGLDKGADDYITKPFNRHELLARIQAAVRRGAAIRKQTRSETSHLQVDSLSMDTLNHQVRIQETEIPLSRTEFRLLQIFCEYAGQVLEREFLLQQVWGYKVPGQSRTVDNFAGRVRRKLQQALEQEAVSHPFIESIYGMGYRLVTSTTRPTDSLSE